jgi:N-acyl homoserine lactone hydrolase
MKLYVLHGGNANLPDMSHLTPGRNVGKPITIPLRMFLIDHPKGLVLFDTGVNMDDATDPFLRADREQRIDRQINRLGYEADAIKYVIMSHLHFDHVGCMSLFPNATFVVRREELRAAWWPDAYEKGYDFDCLMLSRHFKYLQLVGNEAFDVFQDGSVICIDTRGHTEGHQSLIVNLPTSGRIVIAADAAQVADNLDHEIPPGLCWNSQLAVQAIERLQHMRAEGALVILGHELASLDSLKLAPDYYE